MKYIVYLMLFLIVFSVPLSLFGFQLIPSFTNSYASLSDVVSFFDNGVTRGLLSVISGNGAEKKSYYWAYDENFFQDYICCDSDELRDVHYVVLYTGKLDRSDPIWTVVTPYWNDLTGQSSFNRKAKFFFCFDESGSFVRLLILVDGKIYYTDESIYTRLDSSRFSPYMDSAFITYTNFDNEEVKICTYKCSHYGRITDFVYTYFPR